MNPIYLIILSLVGIVDSFYLYYTKTRNKKIVCIIGQDCDAVVKSSHGKTFGIENTLVGILYYAMIIFYGIALILNRNIFKETIVYYFIVIASIGSVLFSIYLTAVQAFILKKWCEYCIVSSIVSMLILLALLI